MAKDSEKRKKAFKEWESKTLAYPELRHLSPGLEDAFNAGWAARREEEYKQRLNPIGMEYYSPVQAR